MLHSIFNSVNFSRNVATSEIFFSFFLGLPKHPFIHRSIFRLPRFKLVLSKIEYNHSIYVKWPGSKVADGSWSLFNNKWPHHHNVISIVKDHYYSVKIFLRFWLAKSTRIIHHNQLLMTKFGRTLRLRNQWRKKCSLLAD